MKGRGLLFALTAVCRGFSNGDQRLLGRKHQDKGKILLGSSLAPAQASPSSGSVAGQCQLPPLLSVRLMMFLTLSRRWTTLGNRKDENSCTVYLSQRTWHILAPNMDSQWAWDACSVWILWSPHCQGLSEPPDCLTRHSPLSEAAEGPPFSP